MIEYLLWPKPYPMILYYRWVLALVPFEVPSDLVLQLGEVILHALIEIRKFLLDIQGGEVVGVTNAIAPEGR